MSKPIRRPRKTPAKKRLAPPRVLAFQHASFCPLGTFGEHLAADGITPTVVELDKGGVIPPLDRFDVLIVLGGPMETWEEEEHPWLAAEKVAIRRWVEELDKPLLGICLGHQVLADALGGRVGRAERGEVGVTPVDLSPAGLSHPVYAGFGPSKRAINWHGSEVQEPPKGAVVLGSTPDCRTAAFAIGSAAFGLQYHVEATADLVGEWGATPGGSAQVERLLGPEGAATVHRAAADAMAELWSNSRRFYDNFMSLARARLDR